MKILRILAIIIGAVIAGAGNASATYVYRAGAYYFDNALPSYSRPQAVVGNATATTVLDMDYDSESGFWKFVVPEGLADTEGYFFAESYLPQGANASLQEVAAALDAAGVSHTDIEGTQYPSPQKVFFPYPFTTTNPVGYSNSGYWRRLDSFGLSPTGSLPVLYIATDSCKRVTSKQQYISGSYYLDSMGAEGIESVGSAESPLALQIKGRGNATWNRHYKKPFRVKFDKKAAILGMSKSKHFALLPHADMNQPYVYDEVGFELARHLGMPWSPSQHPVELVLNGEYEGIYWVCEIIRVEADRVNITEQADLESDPELITGGWLMQIDNISEDVEVWICETRTPYVSFWLSFDTPEVLSAEQSRWIRSYINKVNNAIYKGDYDSDNPEWAAYLDVDDAARYFIAKEVTHDVEGFQGSFHLYKDRGADAKLHFGPVWDFGSSFYNNSFDPSKPSLTLQYSAYNHHWIQELVKYRFFERAVGRIWADFYSRLEWLEPFLAEFDSKVAPVIGNEIKRWNSTQAANYSTALASYTDLLHSKIEYLNKLWRPLAPGDLNADGSIDSADVSTVIEMVLTGSDYRTEADINGDGSLDSADVVALLEMILSTASR